MKKKIVKKTEKQKMINTIAKISRCYRALCDEKKIFVAWIHVSIF
jgi:hypothetical protein